MSRDDRKDSERKTPAPDAGKKPRRALADAETPPDLMAQLSLDIGRPPPPLPAGERAGKTVKVLSKEDSQKGHRKRLRERLAAGGADAMPDYEILELVLCRAITMQDVKPLAKTLLATFGSFAEVINAPPHLLKSVDGVGDRVIDELRLIRVASLRLMKTGLTKRAGLNSWQAVLDYVTAAQAYEQKESFRVLFLDKRNQLLADEVQSRGTVDHTPVYVREVIARALELASTAIILVHNHPSGDPSPSRADIDMTKLIMTAGQPLGVAVHDHIIVGRQGHLSMKAARLI